MSGELTAIRAADLDWTCHLQGVWDDHNFNSPDLNGALVKELVDYALRCDRPGARSPLGRVIIGAAGSGKTHLVGELRRQVWTEGGWFILLDLADVNDFWATAALSYLQSLQHQYSNGIRQGDEILLKLCANTPAVSKVLKSKFKLIFGGEGKEIIGLAKAIVAALRSVYPIEVQRYQAVIKAFVLFTARDPEASDAAYNWLQGVDVEESFLGPAAKPRDVIRGLSWLMSLTGPTLLIVDQIDAIVSVHNHALASADDVDQAEERKALKIIDELAGGLMELRDTTLRTVTVLSSLEATWNALQQRALAPATDRFREPDYIRPIRNGATAKNIVLARLGAAFEALGFDPPYPSWPFRPDAFTGTIGWLPRTVLKRCDSHLRKCLADGSVTELNSFDGEVPPQVIEKPPSNLEERFKQLCATSSVQEFLDAETGENLFPNLLLDCLRCYTLQVETPDDVDLAVEADPNRRRPALHARFRRIYRTEGDREEHYCFRAIPHANAVAFQSRLRAAITSAGIDMALPFRHLFIIRRDPPPSGPKTRLLHDEFAKAGGRFVAVGRDGLKIMLALQTMQKEHQEGLEAWLKERKPLCDVALFREAGLCDSSATQMNRNIELMTTPVGRQIQAGRQSRPESHSLVPAPRAPGIRPASAASANKAQESGPATSTACDVIPVGSRLVGGQPEEARFLDLNLLPRHTAILAGSGSGKTVLLRRIIEEAALLGVPSIVLDTNNDLARLGDAWPDSSGAVDEANREEAHRYFKEVEVVIWTPGIAGGNPIALAPMPRFGSVRSDEDELQQTIVMAHAALKPLIGATGAKAVLKEGVLMQALDYFARSGGEGLDAFVRLLSNLPAEVSDIGNAGKISAEIADLIRAEIAKNPLLSFKGSPLDPAVLLTARQTGKTRISVINFAGLPSDEAKQAFVNQLQMTLFSWVKGNPSPRGRPVTALFVMDEAQNFAPSQKSTPCKESTLALVSQARKYGLAMVFATQVPKNIDNKIISNCTTHFYGKMNSPATIEAVRDLMAAKGGGGSDIASMKAGEFYFTTEGMAVAEKLKTPLCLSYHPTNPLAQDEVVKRARASRS